MRTKQRRTRVREEGWPLIDGWYYCPMHVIDERVEEEAIEIEEWKNRIGVGYEFSRWRHAQYRLDARLAHRCEDGSIRAPTYVERYNRKGGGFSLYGKCKGCGERLSDGIKTIIIMENM